MLYQSFSLNGSWIMDYSADNYCLNELPTFTHRQALVEGAVPGYWEDMNAKFRKMPFYRFLKVNPEYGVQSYPIVGDCPDMALPNVMGTFFYQRTFNCATVTDGAVIYFGGVQSAVSVWLNGTFVGRHEGYSTPFEMKIPEGLLIEGENTLTMAVSNYRLKGFAGQPVSGITSRAASEYSGGIIGDVELRVYKSGLRDFALLVSDDLKTVTCRIVSEDDGECSFAVSDGDKIICEGVGRGEITFRTEGMEYWSPENPKRYLFTLRSGDAVIERKFGVRRLTVDGTHLRLNGKPYYMRGICEHCYYPLTVYPVQDISFYRMVIRKFKELGFNYIRFHTYVAPDAYFEAADELGMLMHVESPNNTTLGEWKQIVDHCRRFTSVIIYCCGNELQIRDDYMEHLRECSEIVHRKTDALFSPQSALRELEYAFFDPTTKHEVIDKPFSHNPRKFKEIREFSDLFNCSSQSYVSHRSLLINPEKMDSWSYIYERPRMFHEISIDGTYTDLSLKERYKGTRIGDTDMFDSLERHLEEKGLRARAPLYFSNSCQWQRRIRKHIFEQVRRCRECAGYDYLGPIDTHWHTFGYDVGMMNEFYELKPGESVRNVLMYNSPTVLLNDLPTLVNFASGDSLKTDISVSLFGVERLTNATLDLRLTLDGRIIEFKRIDVDGAEGGKVTKLCTFEKLLPTVDEPGEMKLYAALNADGVFAENEWELYLFPKVEKLELGAVHVSDGFSENGLISALEAGKRVVSFGSSPFATTDLTFQMAKAGRTGGNLATVINDHPVTRRLPHSGYCGWQFRVMMENARAVKFDSDSIPFEPIIEIVSSHKNIIRQGALFEFNALGGKFIICSFRFEGNDPGATWLKKVILDYANSAEFEPKHTLTREQLGELINTNSSESHKNTNFELNPNDKTAFRKD